jgi:hypothetical protein
VEGDPPHATDANNARACRAQVRDHNKIGIIVDENLNCVAHSELRKRAARKMNFVVIDGDSGEDITRILLAQN